MVVPVVFSVAPASASLARLCRNASVIPSLFKNSVKAELGPLTPPDFLNPLAMAKSFWWLNMSALKNCATGIWNDDEDVLDAKTLKFY